MQSKDRNCHKRSCSKKGCSIKNVFSLDKSLLTLLCVILWGYLKWLMELSVVSYHLKSTGDLLFIQHNDWLLLSFFKEGIEKESLFPNALLCTSIFSCLKADCSQVIRWFALVPGLLVLLTTVTLLLLHFKVSSSRIKTKARKVNVFNFLTLSILRGVYVREYTHLLHSPLRHICIKTQLTVKQFHYYTNEIGSITNYQNPDSVEQSQWTVCVSFSCQNKIFSVFDLFWFLLQKNVLIMRIDDSESIFKQLL